MKHEFCQNTSPESLVTCLAELEERNNLSADIQRIREESISREEVAEVFKTLHPDGKTESTRVSNFFLWCLLNFCSGGHN